MQYSFSHSRFCSEPVHELCVSHHTIGLLPHNARSKRAGICCIIDINPRNQLVTVDIVKLSFQPRMNMCKQLINHKLNCIGC